MSDDFAIIHNLVLLATGAGFSADSGLAVVRLFFSKISFEKYKDIANVPAYHKLGLTYRDLCVPRWLGTNPELFYGIQCTCELHFRILGFLL